MFYGLYFKHMTIVNDDSSVVSEQSLWLIDNLRVIIYDRRKFIIQATDYRPGLIVTVVIYGRKLLMTLASGWDDLDGDDVEIFQSILQLINRHNLVSIL